MTGEEKEWFERIRLIQSQMIPLSLIDNNTGQIPDVPSNPRFIRDEKFEALKQSIMDDPEFLSFNEIKVYPLNGRYVDIGGNMRTRALKELGVAEAPCKVMPEDTPASVLRSRIMKDNYGYGEYDQQILREEWDLSELDDWDMDDIITFDKDDDEFFEDDTTDFSDKNKEIDIDTLDEKVTMKLQFSVDENRFVRSVLSRVDANIEQALLKTLGYDGEEA